MKRNRGQGDKGSRGQGRDKNGTLLFQNFLRYTNEFSLLKKGDRVLIGVSGGPDSTALCYLFKNVPAAYDLKIILAHLNHGLRKKEGAHEEKFVKMLGKQLGAHVIIERVDVKAFCKKNPALSLQEAARELRFAFFARAAKKSRADKAALAHHADDQAETLLLRLIEGTGMEGLSGIHPKREIRGMTVIRPLLCVTKDEILEYLKKNKISYCVDSSNEKLVYKRNKIRKRLLPALEKINPGVRENLLRLQNISYHENQLVEQIALKAEKQIVRHDSEGRAHIALKKFLRNPLAVQRRVLKKVFTRVRASGEDILFAHVERLRLWMAGVEKNLILPDGICVEKEKEGVCVRKKGKPAGNISPWRKKLSIPGNTVLKDAVVVHAEVLPAADVSPSRLKTSANEAFLDYAKTGSVVYARPRKPGDRFMPYGMRGEKRLKDFYIEKKIARDTRVRLPVFENGKHIVWVPAGRIDERAKVDIHTQNVLHLWMEGV